jgi:hypothetical protein
MATARALDVDMTDVFSYLTDSCVRLSRAPATVLEGDTSDWLLTDSSTSWPGTFPERGWRFLRTALARHDGPATDFRYHKATFETLLSYDRFSPPPQWLMHTLEINHPEWLLRAYLRFENLEGAIECAISLVRKVLSNSLCL